MSPIAITWIAIGVYVAITIALTIRGALRTSSLSEYAVGNRDIPPALVGLSLTAQITSVATFVINPGLIYMYGTAGLAGLGGAAALGIFLGLIFFSGRFRKTGSQVQALTIPQWIGARYESPGLRLVFGVLSLALVTFAVLIVVGLALTLGKLLKLDPQWITIGVVVFVLSYIMIGGANTHAYTNAIQASIMLVVALILIGSGLSMFWKDGGLLTKLAAIDPNLVAITNPKSLYFRNLFEVFACNFLVGVAIVCQPHILGKALYLKEDKQVRSYLTVAILAGTVFVAVMLIGLYARAKFHAAGMPLMRMDHVVPKYIATQFSPTMGAVIGIGILCAGLSTLEGILLALSAIISIDLFLPFASKQAAEGDEEALQKKAMRVGRIGLVCVGLVCVALCFWQLNSPTGGSVAIFAQYGIYLLFTASFFPLVCGMFLPSVSRLGVSLAVAGSVVAYLSVSYFKLGALHNNPAYLATCGMFVGALLLVCAAFLPQKSEASTAPQTAKEST